MKVTSEIRILFINMLIFIGSLNTTNAQVVLYFDWQFSGASRSISDNLSLGPSNPWNDKISSIRIPSGWEITVYEHENFKGVSRILTKDWSVTGPNDPWNDKISSIQVRRTVPSKAIITGAEITFNTTSDDKDWDTKPYADILLNGQVIASLDCCSSDKSGDHWNNGSSVSRGLIVNVKASKSDILKDGVCVLGAQGGPHGQGNDTWKFNASLKIRYSDGTWSNHGSEGWTGIEFYSRSRSFEKTNPINLSKH